MTNLYELVEIVHNCYQEKRRVVEVVQEKNFEILTNVKKFEDFIKLDSLFRLKVQVLSKSKDAEYLPIIQKYRCSTCNLEIAVPMMVKPSRNCPKCSEPLELVDTVSLPLTHGNCVVEFEEALRFNYLAIGNAVTIDIGYQDVLAYKIAVSTRSRIVKELTVEKPVLLIVDVFKESEKKTIIDALSKLHSEKAVSGIVDLNNNSVLDVKVIDKDKYIKILTSSFAPSVIYLDVEKILLLSALCGAGCDFISNQDLRFWINILMIGDPSTAKSLLAKAVLEASPRALKLTSDLASKIALIAAEDVASKVVNYGPLVLLDGDYLTHGTVIVEQIETWRPEVIMTLRDVLESGTASRTIRGVTMKFNTRCSFIATANWVKGFYEERFEFIDNLPPVLKNQVDLSRFDALLIFLIPSKEQIVKILDHKFNITKPVLTHEEIKQLIKEARKVKPEISDEAKQYIKDLANDLYDRYSELGLKPLVRTFDSLVRLSIGFAKLTFSSKVTRWHVETIYDALISQLKKVKQHIPTVPPYILDTNPSRRSLKETLYRIILEECSLSSCDKETITHKFKQYIETLVETNHVSVREIEKITGGSIVDFVERFINELAESGIIYMPSHGKVRVVK